MNRLQKILSVSAGMAMLIASSFAANGGTNSGAPHPDASAGASVVGKVKFTGTLPAPTKVSMNADPTCAKLHPGPAMTQDYVAGSEFFRRRRNELGCTSPRCQCRSFRGWKGEVHGHVAGTN